MSTPNSPIANGTWKLNPVHSSVAFGVPYIVGTFLVSVRDFDANLEVADGRATLVGTTTVAGVDWKHDHLAATMLSPDFFDAEQHPELKLVAEDLDLSGGPIEARAQLTIKGVTKDVTLAGAGAQSDVDLYGTPMVGLALSTTIDRTDFGVSANAPLPDGRMALVDDVTLAAELFFVGPR